MSVARALVAGLSRPLLVVGLMFALAAQAGGQAPRADDPVARHQQMLAAAVTKGDERQAHEAMAFLARYRDDPRVVKALAAALKGTAAIAAVAAGQLAALERPAAVPPLLARARSKAVWKQPARLRPLLDALAVTGTGRAASLYFKAMKHANMECARAGIRAMAGLRAGRRAAVERMIGYLESLGGSMRDIRATTARKRYDALSADLVGSITALTGQSFTTDTTAMRRWWRKNKAKVKDKLKPEKKEEAKRQRSKVKDGA